MFSVYFIINELSNRTYTGFTANIKRRKKEHQQGRIKSTRNFGRFTMHILERVNTVQEARQRERFWKSAIGRKKIRSYLFEN